MKFKKGTRVKLTSDVDRYPDFIAKKGSCGTVTYNGNDAIHIQLDEPITSPDCRGIEQPAAEDWDNAVQWYADYVDDYPTATSLTDVVAFEVEEI